MCDQLFFSYVKDVQFPLASVLVKENLLVDEALSTG
jgi:hypothetical protein